MSAVALAGSWRPEELDEELVQFEATLLDNLAGAPGTLGEVARSALAAGGKRTRPRMVFAAAGACGGGPASAEACRPFAMAVEFLHTATLLHDDLVDGARLRRGEAPAYVRFGPKEAVLAGDLLLARCLALVTDKGSGRSPDAYRSEAASILARATERMAIGEALEIELARRTDIDESQYYVFAAAKTAALFAAAAELGGLAAGAPEEKRRRLGRYGEHLGTAFQVVDDVLDLIAPSESSGKETGIDLRAGVPTLPALKALARLAREGHGGEKAHLERVLRGEDATEEGRMQAIELVRRHGVEDAVAEARRLVEMARAELTGFAPGTCLDLMHEMARRAVERMA